MTAASKTTMTTSESTTANAPFGKGSFPDIIFTTADNVDFYLVKAILAFASPFFSDMFSLTQPDNIAQSAGELQRIPVSEDSQTFEALIRFCYPVEDPIISDLGLLEKVLEAALKYQASVVIKTLCNLAQEFVTDTYTALRVYVIACRLGCEQEAMMAANHLKNSRRFANDTSADFSTTFAGAVYIPEMAAVTAAAYYRLIIYVRSGGAEPSSFIEPVRAQSPAAEPHPPSPLLPTSPCRMSPDVVLRSSDGVDTPAHSAILRLAGAGKLLEGDIERQEEQVSVYQVDISSETLRNLVQMLYPLTSHIVTDPRNLEALALAAEKYEISDLTTSLKRQLVSAMEHDPLATYLFANQRGWREEALTAARRIAAYRLENQYTAKMEDVSALPYFRLLQFCHGFNMAAQPYPVGDKHFVDPGTILASRTQMRASSLPSTFPLHLMEMALSMSLNAYSGRSCGFCGASNPRYAQCHEDGCYYLNSAKATPHNIETIFNEMPRWEEFLQEKLSKLELEVHETTDA